MMTADKKNRLLTWGVRIILTLACILMIAWIFSNSLKEASVSTSQSSKVTQIVKTAVETIAPDLKIAETEEEAFAVLHTFVRTAGHFCEFALLGALLTWCLLSYTTKKLLFLTPVPFSVAIAFTDEYIQTFSDGRAWELKDVLTDSFGAVAGFAFALLSVWAVLLLWRIVQKRKTARETENENFTE